MSTWLPEGTPEWGGRPVAHTVAEVAPRCRAVLAGVLRSVEVKGGRIDAQLDDGTDVITLRWLGRECIAGVKVGCTLMVEGTVLDYHARLVVLNPLYSFLQ